MKAKLLIFSMLVALFCAAVPSRAQFKEDPFQQTYNDDDTSASDSTDVMWSFKEFYRGVTHKQSLKVGSLFAGSTVFVGAGQIYNKDYWKLPIIYGGIGAGLAGGFYFKDQGNTQASAMCFAAAGLTYWLSLMDMTWSYQSSRKPHPGKATIYSIMLPGLGQAYLGDWWRIPIYWGGMLGSAHYFFLNRTNYKRFKRIYQERTDESVEFAGPSNMSAETALYYRNLYRRYRDYSVLAFAAFYLLQVIDANVFTYMHDFSINDDLVEVSLAPTIITPDYNTFAYTSNTTGLGVRFGITF